MSAAIHLLPRVTSASTVTPATRAFVRPFRLSLGLAVVSALASITALAMPDVLRDPPMTVGNARGTALVVLLAALPTLLASMRATRNGSLVAPAVWAGALGYLLYNAMIFCFGVVFNRLFPLYVAWLSLAVWSMAMLVVELDARAISDAFGSQIPRRFAAGYLVVSAVAFAALWLADIVPAIVAGTYPRGLDGTAMITNPIEIVDFAFTFPLMIVAAVWLLTRRAWGAPLTAALLVMLSIEAISIMVDQIFGHLADPDQSLAAVPVFIVVGGINLGATLWFFASRPYQRVSP